MPWTAGTSGVAAAAMMHRCTVHKQSGDAAFGQGEGCGECVRVLYEQTGDAVSGQGGGCG
jgi:hypothetical protein